MGKQTCPIENIKKKSGLDMSSGTKASVPLMHVWLGGVIKQKQISFLEQKNLLGNKALGYLAIRAKQSMLKF